jgi:hypothetical protein
VHTWNGTSFNVLNLGDTTAYSSSNATAQDTAGATFEIANIANDNTTFAQLVLKQRSSSAAYARIVASGGSTPILDIINNAIIGIRLDENARVLMGTLTAKYASDSYVHIPVGGASLGALTTQSDTTSARTHWYIRNSNGVVGSVSTSASATTFATSSDYRLKENFEPINNALDVLDEINVYEFNFKTSPDDKVMGVKAHELQEILPYAVIGEKDGIDDETNTPLYQGVDYSKIVPLLVAAVQQLNQKVEALS